MNTDIKLYKVYRVYRKSQRRVIIEKGLTLAQAKRLTATFENSSASMVCFTEQ